MANQWHGMGWHCTRWHGVKMEWHGMGRNNMGWQIKWHGMGWHSTRAVSILPRHRFSQLLLDVILRLRTVSQARVASDGGGPIDQLIHTAEVVERVHIALRNALLHRIHGLFKGRSQLFSAVMSEERHLGLELVPRRLGGSEKGARISVL